MNTVLEIFSFVYAHWAAIAGDIALILHIFPPKTAASKAGDVLEKAVNDYGKLNQ